MAYILALTIVCGVLLFLAPAMVTLLAIDERASLSMQRRDLAGTLMAKAISGSRFPAGEIDLLGYLF